MLLKLISFVEPDNFEPHSYSEGCAADVLRNCIREFQFSGWHVMVIYAQKPLGKLWIHLLPTEVKQ